MGSFYRFMSYLYILDLTSHWLFVLQIPCALLLNPQSFDEKISNFTKVHFIRDFFPF